MKLFAQTGFTLLEVLLALAIIAIGLGALFKATLANIHETEHIKEKTLKHWIAMQGVSMVQLKLIDPQPGVVQTEKTQMLKQTWYWRLLLEPTPLPHVQRIKIEISTKITGPFTDPLYAFRYVS